MKGSGGDVAAQESRVGVVLAVERAGGVVDKHGWCGYCRWTVGLVASFRLVALRVIHFKHNKMNQSTLDGEHAMLKGGKRARVFGFHVESIVFGENFVHIVAAVFINVHCIL